ncbi:MAG TPA: rhodanese-like domain-containing protein [Chitinivibrionales bacterium]
MTILVLITAVIIGGVLFTMFNKNDNAQIAALEAHTLMQAGALTVLDVRTADEFKQGHINKALLIPVDQLSQRIKELSHLKEKKILVYCRSGGRSSSAVRILRAHGFIDIVNLQGGIMSWMSGNLPVVEG